MTSVFKEFSKTYEEFQKQLPNHPLAEELRTRVFRGKLPSDEWLKARIRRMTDLMKPIWLRAEELRPSDSSGETHSDQEKLVS